VSNFEPCSNGDLVVFKLLDKDLGFKKIINLFKKKQQSHVEVGILQTSKDHSRTNLTMAELGVIHEFGCFKSRIPMRSFIRATFDEKLRENHQLSKKLMDNILLAKETEKTALAKLGEVAAKQMVSKINNFIPPPNSEKTIQRKKSSTPLIDTGQLKGSITFEVKS
jgi:hypothetical protein